MLGRPARPALPSAEYPAATAGSSQDGGAARTLGPRRVYQPPLNAQVQQMPSGGPTAAHGGVRVGRVLAAVGGGRPGASVPDSTAETPHERTPPDNFPPALLDADGLIPQRLVPIDVTHLISIMNEVVQPTGTVTFGEIAGLAFAKQTVMEAVVWPMRQPELFSGLRSPPRGLLLFGPPGTGKTLIGRAIAATLQCKFFAISASSLMSKWMGEGERLVRALFAVAAVLSPAVVFVDEIDSLLSRRQDGENDGSRRVKNEFLVQMEGATTSDSERVVLVGATNRPHELDEAARRRLPKRLYIPLPDAATREELLRTALRSEANTITAHAAGGGAPPTMGATAGTAPPPTPKAGGDGGGAPPEPPLSIDACVTLADYERVTDVKGVSRADVLHAAAARLGPMGGVVAATAGYSGSDLMHLCRDAALGPVRDAMQAVRIDGGEIPEVRASDLRPIGLRDFAEALQHVRPSVNGSDLAAYEEWDAEYGSRGRTG